MPSTIQYRYLHRGDNEFLSEPPTNPTESDQEAWDEAWELLKQESEGMQVAFTEDMYTSSEYGDIPDYINVTIMDDMILQFKMARGVIKAIDGATSIVFNQGIDCYASDDFHVGHERIAIGPTGAWVTICAKHSSEEVEVDVSEQFNQAIGETA
jgi:hypothetical protein